MSALPCVMVMAGGTGGHVFPALAVAETLRAQSIRVVWLGGGRGLEHRLVPGAGFEFVVLPVSGLRGTGLRRWLGAPPMLIRAVWQAIMTMRRHRPQVVLGMGGFASGPGGLAARLLRIPLVIHEQNARPGLTNRILSRFAQRVLCGFDATFDRRGTWLGNPVRASIAALPSPTVRFASRPEQPLRLLVLGGSQGARALNELVPQALALLPGSQRPRVRHQAGGAMLEAAQSAYAAAGIEAQIEPFIDDMAAAYAETDLVLCRAGALTLAELAAAGVGALLVPFPYATDDHQWHNGQHLVAAGAARMLRQHDLDAPRLAAELKALLEARSTLLDMACRARALARPEAAQAIALCCLEEARR